MSTTTHNGQDQGVVDSAQKPLGATGESARASSGAAGGPPGDSGHAAAGATPGPSGVPPTAVPPEPGRSRAKLVATVVVVLFALVLIVALYFEYAQGERSTDDAYVTGRLHVISPRVNGTVMRLLIDDNQFVHAGDTLIELDPRDFEVRVALERSRVEQSEAEQLRAQAQIEQAQSAIVSAHADAAKADLDFGRARELTGESPRGLSQQEFDAANAARTSAHARIKEAEAQVRIAQAALASTQAVALQNKADLRDATLQLEYTHVVAPSDGYVGKRTVETGNRIAPGEAIMTIVEPNPWVVANFRETQLRHVTKGDRVELRFDAIPDVVFHGRVDSYSPATGAQFSLLPPDNATGNFTKVTQRVPVKIWIDNPGEWASRILPGLSVVATLEPARRSQP